MKPGFVGASVGLTAIVLFAACGFASLGFAELRGSGRKASETRTVGDFTRIEIASSVDLDAHVGGPLSVVVEGDDNLLSNVTTTVQAGVLIIDAKTSYSSRLGLRVRVGVPKLESVAIAASGDATIEGLQPGAFRLTIAGSGDVNARGASDDVEITIRGSGDVTFAELQARKVAVDVHGSGDVRLRGTTDSVTVTIQGSGDVNAADLKAKQASVMVKGSGDVQLNVTDDLEATVMGSGDVIYAGNPPRVKTTSKGSGDVIKR